jgi:hypothetical protein
VTFLIAGSFAQASSRKRNAYAVIAVSILTARKTIGQTMGRVKQRAYRMNRSFTADTGAEERLKHLAACEIAA